MLLCRMSAVTKSGASAPILCRTGRTVQTCVSGACTSRGWRRASVRSGTILFIDIVESFRLTDLEQARRSITPPTFALAILVHPRLTSMMRVDKPAANTVRMQPDYGRPKRGSGLAPFVNEPRTSQDLTQSPPLSGGTPPRFTAYCLDSGTDGWRVTYRCSPCANHASNQFVICSN